MVVETYDAGVKECRNMFVLNDPNLTCEHRRSGCLVRFVRTDLCSPLRPRLPLCVSASGGREFQGMFAQITAQRVLV